MKNAANAPTTAPGAVPGRPSTPHRLGGGRPAPGRGAHGALASQRPGDRVGATREAHGPDGGPATLLTQFTTGSTTLSRPPSPVSHHTPPSAGHGAPASMLDPFHGRRDAQGAFRSTPQIPPVRGDALLARQFDGSPAPPRATRTRRPPTPRRRARRLSTARGHSRPRPPGPPRPATRPSSRRPGSTSPRRSVRTAGSPARPAATRPGWRRRTFTDITHDATSVPCSSSRTPGRHRQPRTLGPGSARRSAWSPRTTTSSRRPLTRTSSTSSSNSRRT